MKTIIYKLKYIKTEGCLKAIILFLNVYLCLSVYVTSYV